MPALFYATCTSLPLSPLHASTNDLMIGVLRLFHWLASCTQSLSYCRCLQSLPLRLQPFFNQSHHRGLLAYACSLLGSLRHVSVRVQGWRVTGGGLVGRTANALLRVFLLLSRGQVITINRGNTMHSDLSTLLILGWPDRRPCTKQLAHHSINTWRLRLAQGKFSGKVDDESMSPVEPWRYRANVAQHGEWYSTLL